MVAKNKEIKLIWSRWLAFLKNQKYMIKKLSELIEDYNNGQMPSEKMGGFIPFYPTEEHKRQDSVGYMPIQELSKWAKLSNDKEDQKFRNLWK